MKIYGIDVSKHQGSIDWEKVRASGKAEFVILRAGLGKLASQKDIRFDENYDACKQLGIPVGAYWYSYAMTPAEAVQEAQACLEVIKGKQFGYPIWFDFEEPKQLALGITKCTEIAAAFLETMEKAGYFVGLYSSKAHLESCFTEELRRRVAVWVAHYGVAQTNYNGSFGIWQMSDKGSVAGISGNVDLNECYVDYPAIIRGAGLNGFAKTGGETGTGVQDTISVEVKINGETYRGELKKG